ARLEVARGTSIRGVMRVQILHRAVRHAEPDLVVMVAAAGARLGDLLSYQRHIIRVNASHYSFKRDRHAKLEPENALQLVREYDFVRIRTPDEAAGRTKPLA